MKGENGGYIKPRVLFMKTKVTIRQTALCLCLCLFTVLFCDLALPEGEGEVYDSVIRLHVLANSDGEADQALKLKVRDAILAEGVFENCEGMDEAVEGIEKAAEKAVNTANALLAAEGVPYRASYAWGQEDYPTREYEGLRLPSGKYLSLRIVLGKGEGQNWWCVLFPPLCMGSAQKLYIKGNQVFNTQKPKYSFRFFLLELFN